MIKKDGAVLIMVLLIMAVVVGGVISIEQWASKDYDYSQQLYASNQSAFYIHSAIKVAVKLLDNDDNKYDSIKDDWMNLPPFRVNDFTVVSMKIIPLNAKIDINNIKNKDSKLVSRTQIAVSTIFKDANVDVPEYFKRLLLWIKGDKSYGDYELGYQPIKGAFFSLKEIDFVYGLRTFSDRFHNFFTVEDTSGKININFASKKVIEAYLPEIADCAEDIIKYREKKPFENITQIRNVGCISDKDYLKIQPYITTTSNLFAVRINVVINGMNSYATALISRTSKKSRLVKYFEGKGFYE